MDKDKIKILFNKEREIPHSNKFKTIISSFSITEKVIFYCLVCIFVVASLTMLYEVNAQYLVAEPARGGTLIEGEVGSPRFVNPTLATTDADKDLVALTYSGLLKQDATGNLVPNLAQSYTVSPDGLTYTFTLKNNIAFEDGSPITADDVVFTIQKIQDAAIKSPLESAWSSVKISEPDIHTVVLTLSQPYGPFIYNMTVGILEKHIWENISDDGFAFSQFNIKPIGSGPYTVTKVITDSSGLPTEYDLDANAKYALGQPYISNIVLKFYPNETDMINAYNSGKINAMSSVTPENIPLIKRTDGTIMTATLSRVFGIFWNQNNAPVLLDPEVRQALNLALDKQAIINTVLGGYAVPLNGPLPTDIATSTQIAAPVLSENVGTSTASSDPRIAAAQLILEKAGWTLGSDGVYQKIDPKNSKNDQTLSFSLTTSDAPELKAAAEEIQQTWDSLGAQVNVKIFEIGDLNQTIIEPRDYDALLFGEIIPSGEDLYPFWDSAERNSPGLNIALYANIKADAILSQMRATTDQSTVASLEQQFEIQVQADNPAAFLYAPDFIYVVPQDIQNIQLGQMTDASDRFNDVNQWYIEKTSVWKIFAHK